MVAKKYIDKSIPYLKQSDSISFAIEMMEEYGLNQLPVVENQEYKGLINKSILESIPLLHNQSLEEIEPLHPSILVSDEFHIYEIVRIASDLKLEILPVFSEDNIFKGMINMHDVSQDFISKFAAQPIGAIFVLEMKAIDYSLTEISRLVESNEAKIISMYTESDDFDPNLLIVTIKVNTTDLTRVLATFERFEFKILAKFHDHETQKFESSRLDLLLKYLEI
ncbi:CBS domain-containing protein [Chondrinema litorale]|uniref:CBS domain-containing protein n=1 Tax=Chondrinema litorale TaxID=2994555 RepID=UPI0025437E61|nr:CBS domain-containing protein [Chondrinema litorale]UZR95481.1 CBS domain-containing protein [Chondrinema litorale]